MYTRWVGRYLLIGFAMFWISAVTDVIWARYTRHVADGSRHKAGINAAAIIVMAGLGWFGYHTTLWNMIPMGAGAYVGTYYGTKKKVNAE